MEQKRKSKNSQSIAVEGGKGGRRSSNFSIAELSSLFQMLEASEVSEFELERGSERIRIKRSVAAASSAVGSSASVNNAEPVQASLPLNTGASVPKVVPIDNSVSSTPAVEPEEEPVVKSTVKELTSPMVGTFYRRPAPDSKPFVEAGDIVKRGDILCIVEAMKLMNEIESDFTGRVLEVCLDDSQMVEYGEVLFRIDTSMA